MKKFIFTALILLILSNQLFSYTLTDSKNQTYSFESAPNTCISLAPNITEIMFYFNLEKKIVGTVQYSNFPEEAKKIDRIGTTRLDLEKILSKNPDIILAMEGLSNISDTNKLKEFGYKIFWLNMDNFNSIIDSYEKILKLFMKRRDNLIDILKNRIKLLKKINHTNRKKVYFQIWNKPLMSIGNTSFINEIIELSGGENIYKDVSIQYPNTSLEYIISKNPDYIFLCYPVKALENEKTLFKDTNAYKKGNVIILDPNKFTRPGPESFSGLEILYKILNN